MADKPTAISGAALRRWGKRQFVVVHVAKMFPGAPPTIVGLSTKLVLPPDEVFKYLVDSNRVLPRDWNSHVIPKMFSDQFPDDPMPESIAEARRRLKEKGTQYTANDRFPTGTTTPYLYWGVEAKQALVFRRSRGFIKLLSAARNERKRQKRIKAFTPNFKELEKQRIAIKIKAELLRDVYIKWYDDRVKGHGPQIGLLEAARVMVGLLIHAPKDSVSRDDMADMKDLWSRLDGLINEAQKHMITNPVKEIMGGTVEKRMQESKALFDLIRDNSFIKNTKILVANIDIAPGNIAEALCETLKFAYRTLAHTPYQEEVEKVADQVIQMVCSKDLDTSGLSVPQNPAFEGAIKTVLQEPPLETAAVVLIKLVEFTSSVTASAVGNIPGPSSLAVAMIEISAICKMTRLMKHPNAAIVFAGKSFRALCITAGLSPEQQRDLLKAVQKGNLKEIRKVDWSKNFQSSAGWTSSIAIANLIAFYLVANRDDDILLRKICDLASTGSGSAVAGLEALHRFGMLSRSLRLHWGAKALGAVGGLAMVVSGGISAHEDYTTGDVTGAWISGSGAAGGLLSVGGFLLGAGATVSVSGVGVPVGTILMALGAVLAIGSGIVDIIRDLLLAKTRQAMKPLLEDFSKPGSAYDRIVSLKDGGSLRYPKLKQSLEKVWERHAIDFWDIHPKKCPELWDVGFTVKHIEGFVDEDFSRVTNILKSAGREWWKRELKKAPS